MRTRGQAGGHTHAQESGLGRNQPRPRLDRGRAASGAGRRCFHGVSRAACPPAAVQPATRAPPTECVRRGEQAPRAPERLGETRRRTVRGAGWHAPPRTRVGALLPTAPGWPAAPAVASPESQSPRANCSGVSLPCCF